MDNEDTLNLAAQVELLKEWQHYDRDEDYGEGSPYDLALTAAIAALEREAASALRSSGEAVAWVPEGYELVAVKGFHELVFWLDRCADKGHLDNCPDLIEPWEAFDYRTPPTSTKGG